MIQYGAIDQAWFNREIQDTAKLAAQLDQVIADQKPGVTVMEWQKLSANAENVERDRMRLAAIRAQAYIAGKREQQEKVVRCGRALLVWFSALALFAGWLWWRAR